MRVKFSSWLILSRIRVSQISFYTNFKLNSRLIVTWFSRYTVAKQTSCKINLKVYREQQFALVSLTLNRCRVWLRNSTFWSAIQKFVLRCVTSRFSAARTFAVDSLENFFDAGKQTRTRCDSLLKARERAAKKGREGGDESHRPAKNQYRARATFA